MFSMSRLFVTKTLLLVIVLANANGQKRKIHSTLNPGCNSCPLDKILVYTRADSSQDTIHQIWDFTRGTPTMLFVVTSLNATMDISWKNFVPWKFNASETPEYSFGIALDRIVEFDDIKDLGYIDQRSPRRSFNLNSYSPWHLDDHTLNDTEEATITLHTIMARDRKIIIQLDLLPYQDYAAKLPHLIHTANSTLIDISLVNLTTSSDYNSSRYALHFVLASSDPYQDSFQYTMRKSLDDEHTPGVFEIIEIQSPASSDSSSGGYLQFRPVGYTQQERGVTTTTLAHVSDFGSTSFSRHSTLGVFYADWPQDKLLVQDLFVSFGEPGDGFYKQHNYTSWSFTAGYGAPPLEGFSLFVILVISIGLSLPVLLAVSGAVYVVVRRCRRDNLPTRFTDEE